MCQTVVGVAIFDVREENVVDLLFQLERLRCRIDSLVPVADSPVPDRLPVRYQGVPTPPFWFAIVIRLIASK
jgi:hypothetical protein